jgi:hypothetical protein
MKNDDKTGTNLVSLADARQQREENEADVAPYEAFEPQAVKLQGDDWLVTACDGEQNYVYLVTKAKRAKTLKVVEVYPGLAKKRTSVRDASEPIDLVFTGKHTDLNDVIEDIAEALLGDLEEEDGSGAVVN